MVDGLGVAQILLTFAFTLTFLLKRFCQSRFELLAVPSICESEVTVGIKYAKFIYTPCQCVCVYLGRVIVSLCGNEHKLWNADGIQLEEQHIVLL